MSLEGPDLKILAEYRCLTGLPGCHVYSFGIKATGAGKYSTAVLSYQINGGALPQACLELGCMCVCVVPHLRGRTL